MIRTNFQKNYKGNSLIAVLVIVLVLSIVGSTLMLTTKKNEDILTETKRKEEIKYELKLELLKLINYVRMDYAANGGCPPFYYGYSGCTDKVHTHTYDQSLNNPVIYCNTRAVCATLPMTDNNTQYFVNPASLNSDNNPHSIPYMDERALAVGFPNTYFNTSQYGYFIFRPKIFPPLSDPTKWKTLTGGTSTAGPGEDVVPVEREINPPVLAIHLMIVDTHLGSKSMNTIDAIVLFFLYPVTEGTQVSNNRIMPANVLATCSVCAVAKPWDSGCSVAGTSCSDYLARTGQITDLRYRTQLYTY